MSMRVFTFLNPVDIPPGRAYMLLPDRRTIEPVESIPEWYWPVNERIVGLTLTGLAGNMILATYFTCCLDDGGHLFKTVAGDEAGEYYSTLASAKTYEEALREHERVQRQMRAQTMDPPG